VAGTAARICQGECGRPLTKLRIEQNKRKCGPCEAKAKRAAKARTHERMAGKLYGLLPGDYARMYEAQGGRCAICRRATGKTKRLATDHDHMIGNTREAVRGLLCSLCNRMVGNARDDPEFFERAAEYLRHPPAREVLSDGG
jgi:hypothetical protein